MYDLMIERKKMKCWKQKIKKIGKNMFEYKTGSEEDMPWMHQNSYCLFKLQKF